MGRLGKVDVVGFDGMRVFLRLGFWLESAEGRDKENE